MEEKDRLSPDIYIYSDTESNDERYLPDNQIAVPEEQHRQFHHIGELRSNRSNPKEKKIIRIGQSSVDGSQGGMVYSGKGVAMTLCAAFHGYAMGFILRRWKRK